jgi:hypothetical protein
MVSAVGPHCPRDGLAADQSPVSTGSQVSSARATLPVQRSSWRSRHDRISGTGGGLLPVQYLLDHLIGQHMHGARIADAVEIRGDERHC